MLGSSILSIMRYCGSGRAAAFSFFFFFAFLSPFTMRSSCSLGELLVPVERVWVFFACARRELLVAALGQRLLSAPHQASAVSRRYLRGSLPSRLAGAGGRCRGSNW